MSSRENQMFATIRRIRIAMSAAGLLVPAHASVAQSLENAPVTVNYANIGPMMWMPSPGIKANIVAPNITAGARVSCFHSSYRCDISVQPRTLESFALQPADLIEEVKRQFKSGSPLALATTPQGIEARYLDPNPGAQFRYVLVSILTRGPAIVRAVVQGPDSVSVDAMANIARTVRPVAAREKLAAQFAQFVAVCNTRAPATTATNERALSISAFSDASVLATSRQRDSSMTLEKVRAARATPAAQQLALYDRLRPSSRETFCTQLPGMIAAATRELRTM